MDKPVSTITIVLIGDASEADLKAMAERAQRAIRGQAVPATTGTDEFKSCDGINLFDKVCIGSSK